MVIFFGGLPGVGKTSLAETLSRQFGIYHYDLDVAKRKLAPMFDKDYQKKLDINVPISPVVLQDVFHAVAKEFAKLALTNKHIIVSDVFHNEVARQILLDAAKIYFGGYIFVLIEADDAIVVNRLSTKSRGGHLLKDPIGMRENFKSIFEQFEHPDIVFCNDSNFDDSASCLASVIKEKLYG